MCEIAMAQVFIKGLRTMMAESQESLEEALEILEKMARKEFLGFSFEQRLHSLVLAEFRDEISLLIGISTCPYCEMFVYPEARHTMCEQAIDRYIYGERPVVASVEDYFYSEFDDDDDERTSLFVHVYDQAGQQVYVQ